MLLRVAILTTDKRESERDYAPPVPGFGTAPTALLRGFAQLPGVEVHVVSCTQQPVPSPEKLAGNIWFHGLHVPKIGWLRTGYQGCIRAVRKKLREIQPDIVHGQGTERDCAVSAVLSGFPNILTIHGNMRQVAKALGAKPFTFHWLMAPLESWTIRRTSGVVCLTRYTRQQVESLARRTWVVPNAVDETFFAIGRAPVEPPMLLCVADIFPYKNQNSLIRTLDPVASQRNFRLVFLGNLNHAKTYGAEFLELVKARPWCSFEGFKKGDALKAALRAAYLLVLPTREDNCPMVVLEAMAAGVPVAASRIGGIPDLIDDGVNGLLFDPNNTDGMRAAIVRLLSNPEAAHSTAVAGQNRARERHRPVQIAQRHLEIYRDVLNIRS